MSSQTFTARISDTFVVFLQKNHTMKSLNSFPEKFIFCKIVCLQLNLEVFFLNLGLRIDTPDISQDCSDRISKEISKDNRNLHLHALATLYSNTKTCNNVGTKNYFLIFRTSGSLNYHQNIKMIKFCRFFIYIPIKYS